MKKNRLLQFTIYSSLFTTFLATLFASAEPGWWTERGVLSTNTPNDFAAVNQGQLKHLVTEAAAEMDAAIPQFGGVGSAISNLVSNFTDQDNYLPVNLGQLKAVATPFYDWLIAIGYSTNYPWYGSTNAPDDYAIANIGQAKNLFSFDLALDSDSDGLPDWWELRYFGGVTNAVAGDPSPLGDGESNLEKYLLGKNPTLSAQTDADGVIRLVVFTRLEP
ncbi:MAG: sugar-binding protein [Kiritimatiellia bacterium]|nr:sugar-binding protein [Kiritimatiellia bacterium]